MTPTPDYVPVTLAGGPFHGRRFKVKAGSVRLGLTTRPKHGKGDKPPVALYAGDGASGLLDYTETVGGGPARRRRNPTGRKIALDTRPAPADNLTERTNR